MTHQNRIDKGMYWDRAWSLVKGCTPVSPGCNHCWSAQQAHIRAGQSNEKIQARYGGLTNSDGHWTGKIRLMEQDLDKPRKVKKPTTWAIWNDLFHEDIPASFLLDAFDTIAETPQHTYLILTKRPVRMYEFITSLQNMQFRTFESLHSNVWLGVTIENQEQADTRIPILLQTPAAVRFGSFEPLLELIEIPRFLDGMIPPYLEPHRFNPGAKLDLVICGAETGPHRRLMKLPWAHSLRDQCTAAGVPFFFKQDTNGNHKLNGRTWEEFPKHHLK